MATETPPSPFVDQMRALLTKGRAICLNDQAAFIVGNVWIHQVRHLLSKLYGTDTTEVNYWCAPAESDPEERVVKRRVAVRLPRLEQLAAILDVPTDTGRVFLGHGRSQEWLKLHLFLSNNLSLPCDEFNIEAAAGIQTVNRIESMLRSATMAFLVMTAEDRHEDGTFHARENVIHEIGLFQARLGSRRAIVLVENTCARFSNLDGLTTINFPPGDILARSEEIRGVLARENIS